MLKRIFVLLVLSAFCILSGAELFVGPGQKYKTVNAAAKAVKDGDTVTIMPGRYYESVNIARKLKNVTFRAQIPGSVLIHGDKPAPEFKLVPGYKFVYAADWNDNVTAVNERDNFKIYFPAASVDYLEFNFGYWFKKDGKLYISTTDGKAPETHDLTVSVLKGDGLKFSGENCLIEGLAFSGFYSHYRTTAWSGINGCQLAGSTKSVIRNCAEQPRPDQDGTWITSKIIRTYCEFHRQKMAHSFEAYLPDGTLAGGLYGIVCGRIFCGESMFYHVSGASKYVLVKTVELLKERGFVLLDTQMVTETTKSFGAKEIPCAGYFKLLDQYGAAVTPYDWN